MKKLFMHQKAFTLRGNFSVQDEANQDVYLVEGSFMQVPKRFTIRDMEGEEVAVITKKVFSFLPTFYIDASGQKTMAIKKEFTFLKSRYTIDGASIEVSGNWWDMEFEVLQHGEVIGAVSKNWFTWGERYTLTIYKSEVEPVLVSLVVTINYVKASQAAAGANAGV